jgi:phosphate transport system permease protein
MSVISGLPTGGAKARLPEGEAFKKNLGQRHARGKRWSVFFLSANLIAVIALVIIFLNIVNQAFGLIILRNAVEPATLTGGRELNELSEAELGQIIINSEAIDRNRARAILLERFITSTMPRAELVRTPLGELISELPDEFDELTLADVDKDTVVNMLSAMLSADALATIVEEEIVQPTVVASWRLFESLFNRAAIDTEIVTNTGEGNKADGTPYRFRATDTLEWHSWLNADFITSPLASTPTTAGLRTALFGSMWIIIITLSVSLPLGVGAAIYLEEYAAASRNWFGKLVETNIRNLAGVPSIIYGMLGLAVFVRALGTLTSGQVIGITDSNGRTVLSAGLTLALLILPVMIINAQEAIRAVPSSIREASYGVGATKWQTIWRQVLPAAFPGILTGMILSMSRAVGETAPLIVVGASTFISSDPNGPFSKFTVVPIQIYQWTTKPDLEFKNVAGAAIIVLIVLLLALNATAIILRNYFSRRLQG